MLTSAIKGIFAVTISTYFWSLLFTLFFRFPVPFGGYTGPWEEGAATVSSALSDATMAFLFYFVLGGFLLVLPVGVLVGVFVEKDFASASPRIRHRNYALMGGIIGFCMVLVLSVLDLLIGPW
ncbi:hypothetical protein [Alteromonas sp. CYL-A6]|uniref:hypothetical protein n=1 Tax=Alteromonas nitratireducens TaxID=3390813 RepID=UPI0034ACEC7A